MYYTLPQTIDKSIGDAMGVILNDDHQGNVVNVRMVYTNCVILLHIDKGIRMSYLILS